MKICIIQQRKDCCVVLCMAFNFQLFYLSVINLTLLLNTHTYTHIDASSCSIHVNTYTLTYAEIPMLPTIVQVLAY